MTDLHDALPVLPSSQNRLQVSSPLHPLSSTNGSWPGEPEKPAARASRPRANTTPSQSTNNVRTPSNLSTCTTLNSHDQSNEGSPLYMKGPCITSLLAHTLSAPPPLDLDSETSYFEDDDDEEESPRAKFVKVFRRRGSSNTDSTLEKDSLSGRPKRRFRKRVSDANQTLKCVFGIKK